MSDQSLSLEYKGERNYLHGTDIYNETLAWLVSQKSQVNNIDFAFHRLAVRQLKITTDPLPAGVEPVAVCSFISEHGRERASLVELEQEVSNRYPYPEDDIVSAMQVDLVGRTGLLHGDCSYSDIEVWVAMTKDLHYKVFSQLEGKWLFVRARFPRYVRHSTCKERTLKIASSFNDKLTRSEAFIDGEKIGEIYFSIV